MTDVQCEPENFKGRIILLSMYNDIDWKEKGNKEQCEYKTQKDANRDHWPFLGPGSEKQWYGTYSDKPDGVWDTTAEDMILEFAETIHPMFLASSAPERGKLRSKGGGKKTIHFTGSEQNVELILRTVMSAKQLSIYGAVADIPWLQGNQKHMQHKILWRRWKFPPNLLLPSHLMQKDRTEWHIYAERIHDAS